MSCLTDGKSFPKPLNERTKTMNTHNATITNAAASAISTSADDMIPGTGWTWADAVDMAAECRREDRLFSSRSRPASRPRLTAAQRYARRAAKFFAETGWTLADAMSEAIEARRDQRLYGNGHYAAV